MSGRSESRSETPRSENQNDEIEKQEVCQSKTFTVTITKFISGHRTGSKYGGSTTTSKRRDKS